jgi:hypothetical protein
MKITFQQYQLILQFIILIVFLNSHLLATVQRPFNLQKKKKKSKLK